MDALMLGQGVASMRSMLGFFDFPVLNLRRAYVQVGRTKYSPREIGRRLSSKGHTLYTDPAYRERMPRCRTVGLGKW